MLSSLIFAATHMIEKSDAKMTKIYNGVNAMEEKKDGALPSQELTIKGNTRVEHVYIDIYQDKDSGLMSYEKHGAGR